MKMRGRVTLLFCVLVLAAAVAAWAQAPAGGGMKHPPAGAGQMGHGPGQGGPMGGPMGMLAKLNLTQEQKDQVHKLMADTQAQQQADRQQMQKLHEQLRDQIFADGGPSANAGATAQDIGALQAKMIQAHVAMAEKISAILTAEQRKQLREMPMGDMRGMMGPGMMGPGMMRPQGGEPKK